MATHIKPFLRYQGNKFKLLPFLKEHITVSKDQLWIEPFLGSGAVVMNFEPENAICSDINPYLTQFIQKYLRNEQSLNLFLSKASKLADKMEMQGTEFYYDLRSEFNKTHDVFLFMVLNIVCFNGICRFNKQGEFNSSFCNNPSKLKKSLKNWKVKLQEVINILQKHPNWTFCCADFRATMKFCNEKSVCYLDPPYFNANTAYYSEWTKQDTLDMLQLVNDLPGEFWISSSINDKDESILDYIPFNYDMYSTDYQYIVGGVSERRKTAKEILIRKK